MSRITVEDELGWIVIHDIESDETISMCSEDALQVAYALMSASKGQGTKVIVKDGKRYDPARAPPDNVRPLTKPKTRT